MLALGWIWHGGFRKEASFVEGLSKIPEAVLFKMGRWNLGLRIKSPLLVLARVRLRCLERRGNRGRGRKPRQQFRSSRIFSMGLIVQ